MCALLQNLAAAPGKEVGIGAAFRAFRRNGADAMEPLLGSIILFGGNFEPRGWAFCNGQSLEIAQYSALYSLLGTTYGGDGVATFNLPDLRGWVPVHAGTGQGSRRAPPAMPSVTKPSPGTCAGSTAQP